MGAEDKDRMDRDAVDEAEEAKKEREEPMACIISMTRLSAPL